MEDLEAIFLNLSMPAILAGLVLSLMALRGDPQNGTGQDAKASPVWARRLAASCVALGLALILAALTARGISAGYWPPASPYEFVLACGAAMLLTWLALPTQRQGMMVAGGVLLLAILALGYARLGMAAAAQAPRPPTPVLDSIWLQLHALTLAVAYGAFSAAAVGGLLYLAQGWIVRLGGRANMIESHALEDLSLWAVSLGLPWLTLAMITGIIWSEMAWGSYWNWEPKEVLTLATWVIYVIYLHARTLRGWRGRPLAFLAVLGLVLAIINFLWAGSLARSLAWETLRIY